MSFGSRLKEKREALGITQPQLAKMLNVSKGAIGNWETDINSPRATLLYDLFDILHCDANYLFQDETKDLYKDEATPDEFEKIIKKYRALDAHGREMVDFTLEKEYERSRKLFLNEDADISYDCTSMPVTKVAESISEYGINAAHERTDTNVNNDMKKYDENIMDDDDF